MMAQFNRSVNSADVTYLASPIRKPSPKKKFGLLDVPVGFRQASYMASPPLIQPKLTVGAVDDKYEREADSIASTIMRMPQHDLSSDSASPILQRKTSNTAAIGGIPPSVRETLQSPGQPLDSRARAFMEPRFGHDFSKVRIHSDSKASESARAINAKAYTVGSDVAFEPGRYAPDTQEGRTLLGHELAHVVQNSSAPMPNIIRRWPRGVLEQQAIERGRRLPPTRMGFQDCTPEHTQGIRAAANAGIAAIGRTVNAISQDPLPQNVSDALTTYFGNTGPLMTAYISRKLNIIARGLPRARFECEYPDGVLFNYFCGNRSPGYVRPGLALFGVGDIHICQPEFHSRSALRRMEAVVHEGAHQFIRVSDNDGAYYVPNCQQTDRTRNLTDAQRLDNADSYACLVQTLG